MDDEENPASVTRISVSGSLPQRQVPSFRIDGGVPSGERRTLPEYDIIVIGGGINGTAIALDAATRQAKNGQAGKNPGEGLKVLLLEKNDFGAGTSATSSRLIHGGLRYLKNVKTSLLSWRSFSPRRAVQEAGLVHESLQERERLLRNAPHLVRPLPSVLPVFDYNKDGMAALKTGMTLYDLLSHGKSMPNHRTLGRQEFLTRYPQTNPQGLQGGYLYYDAQANLPERLCVENALAAKETGNATVLNHAEVTGITVDVAGSNREASGVTFRDVLTGEEFIAKGKVIVNAAGPWVDELIQKLPGVQTARRPDAIRRRMGGTKGSHIVVKRWPGGPEHAFYASAKSDGRPFFILPWRNDYYLIGTTDIRYDGNLDRIVAERREVDYLLRETNQVFPAAQLKEGDVLYTTSGVRPLLYEPDKPEAEVTRKHVIEDHGRDTDVKTGRFISIIGGKLTTERNLAEEAVDYIVDTYRLRMPNGARVGRSQTRERPLPGGEGIANLEAYKQAHVPVASRNYGVPEATVSHLIDLYGSRYNRVLALTAENPAWKATLHSETPTIGAEVIYALRSEMAVTLADVLLRRTGSGLDADAGLKAAEPAARLMAGELGWDENRIRDEVQRYRQWVESTMLGFRMQNVP